MMPHISYFKLPDDACVASACSYVRTCRRVRKITNKQTNKQTSKQTNTQTNKQTKNKQKKNQNKTKKTNKKCNHTRLLCSRFNLLFFNSTKLSGLICQQERKTDFCFRDMCSFFQEICFQFLPVVSPYS